MEQRKQRYGRLFAFGSLALFLLIVGGILWTIFRWLDHLASDLERTIVAAGLTVIGSMVTLAVGKAYEARISLRKELREKKAPVYEELVHRFFDIFYAEQMGKPKASQMQYMEFFIYGIEKLTAWGSNKAVRTFGDLRNNGGDFVLKIEAFLMALREDLGHSASDMPPGSILRLFVNDIDEHIEKVRLDHSTSTERLPPR